MEFDATQAITYSISDEDEPNPSKSHATTKVAQLKVTAHEGQSEQLHMLYSGESVIGRRSESQITIPAKTISKRHAVIEVTDDVHMIHDLGSVNKTRRGKIVLKPNVRYELQDGDVLRFGDVTCIYTKTVKRAIASDSDTDTESLIRKPMPESTKEHQKNTGLTEASDSDTGSEPVIKKPLPLTDSTNEQESVVTAAVQAAEESDSDTAPPSLIKQAPLASSVMELSDKVDISKQPQSNESEPVTTRSNHLADFMKTGLILSDSEYSDSDEEAATTEVPPKLQVPETPACEIKQTTSSMQDSSPAVGHKRFTLGRLMSSSDSDTDIDDEIENDKNTSTSKKEADDKCAGACSDASDLEGAETQIYPVNVTAEKISAVPKSSTSEKHKPAKGPMKAQPTIVPVDSNIDCLELPTQPNSFNGSFTDKDDDEVAMASTSKLTKSVAAAAARKPADDKEVEESENSDWASMATQPYIIGKTANECLNDSDENEDIFDAATQLYPANRIEARAKFPMEEDGKNEEAVLGDNLTIGTDAAAREAEEMPDLALADTVPIELFECDGGGAKDDDAAQKPESEEACFNSPPCTDEEISKLKETIAEVLKSPALALSQEISGDSNERTENAANRASDNKEHDKSPALSTVDKRTKTKAAKATAPRTRAPSGRMSSRQRTRNATALAVAEAEIQAADERRRSAFRAYHKPGVDEDALAEPETSSASKRSPIEDPNVKPVKFDGAHPSEMPRKGKRDPGKQNDADITDITDSAAGSNATPSKEAGDSKYKSPTVIGPTPPSGPRSRRSMHRRAPEMPESDSSDNSQELASRRRTLRGSALKKAAAKTTPRAAKSPTAPKPAKKRAALAFDSSDDDSTDALEDQGSSAVDSAKTAPSATPEKLEAENAAAITESQWQRLEEEIAELSGEAGADSTAKPGTAVVPAASGPPVRAKGKRKSFGDAGEDTVIVEAAEAKAAAEQVEVVQPFEADVPKGRRAGKKPGATEPSPQAGPSEEGEASALKTYAKDKSKRASKTLAVQKEVSENPAEDLAKEPSNVANAKVEPEAPKQLPVSEVHLAEVTASSPRRGRSSWSLATRSLGAKGSSQAAKGAASTDAADDGIEDVAEDSGEKRSRRKGATKGSPQRQNRKANAKNTKSSPRQATVTEDLDSKNDQGNKRVSWSQDADAAAENLPPDGKAKARRISRGAMGKFTKDVEAPEQPGGKRRASRSANARAGEDPAAENPVAEKTKAGRRSKNASAGELDTDALQATDAEVVPKPRAQRKSTSKYRRLMITSDSAIDSATTEYESEPSPTKKATPAKRTSAAQRRGSKAKAELDEITAPESAAAISKSTPKRVAAREPKTPAKRRRGPSTLEEPPTEDQDSTEASSRRPQSKRLASPWPAITKRARISKPGTAVAEEQDSDIESLDEFEPASLSPLRGARGRTSKAAKKTPPKKMAEPELTPKATPRRTKGSPRAQSKNEAETPPKIMFTGISEKSLEKIVRDLNGSLVDSVFECTHLVTDKVRRTWKFLCMLARGCHIVSSTWLKQCKMEKAFIDAAPYVITDENAEKQYNFKLRESLTKARNESFLNGYRIHATKNVKPPPQEMQTIIKCAGGTYLSRMPTAGKDTVVVTCPEDLHLCAKARNGGVAVVGTEFILTGVLKHVVEIEPYRC